MNLRRGIFRIWVIISSGWVALVLFLTWSMGTLTPWFAAVYTFVPPIVLGILIFLMFWVIDGFQKRKQGRYVTSAVMQKPKPPQGDLAPSKWFVESAREVKADKDSEAVNHTVKRVIDLDLDFKRVISSKPEINSSPERGRVVKLSDQKKES
jgi:hypothetical protein